MPSWGLPPAGLDGPREVPAWASSKDEEVVIGHGTVPPEIGTEDDRTTDTRKSRGSGHVLLRGVGLVDISQMADAPNGASSDGAATAPPS